MQQVEDIALSQDSDWHALTPREEKDLETLMAQCDFAISNAELFAEQLSKDLSVLDGVSISFPINIELIFVLGGN